MSQLQQILTQEKPCQGDTYTYDCDAGTLALSVNGAVVRINNRDGDGCHKLIVSPDEIPQGYRLLDLSVSGPACVRPLDYDCEGGNPLTTIALEANEELWIYRSLDGDFIFKRRQVC